MELDKDTLDKLIAHFRSVLKNIQEDTDEEEDDLDPDYSRGYDTGLLTAIIHLQLLQSNEIELKA